MNAIMAGTQVGIVCIGLTLLPVASSAGPDSLFSPLSPEDRMRFEEDAKVDLRRDRSIVQIAGATLNVETFLDDVIRRGLVGQPSRPVVANLFEGMLPLTLVTERVREIEPGYYEWVGHIQDDLDSRVFFVVREGQPSKLAGTIATRGRFYRIGSNQSGVHTIVEVDLSQLPNESAPQKVLPQRMPGRQQIPPIEMKFAADWPAMTIITDRVEASREGYLEWHGHLEGDSTSRSVIVLKEDNDRTRNPSIVGGIISTSESTYRIGKDWPVPLPIPPRGGRDPVLFEVDLSQIHPPESFWKEVGELRLLKAYPGCQIDVMVAYTPDAKSSVSTITDIDMEIDVAFTAANDALDRSDVHFTLNRVGKAEVQALFASGAFQYHDDGIINKDLSELSYNDNNTMTALYTVRDTVHADLVNLWIAAGKDSDTGLPSCGMANLMETLDVNFRNSAFSVVPRACVNRMSFLHELAHNMGANHDRGFWNPSPTSHERGYGFFYSGTSNGGPWGTIMAVKPNNVVCPTVTSASTVYPWSYGCRVFVFSNPAISIGGIQAGVAGPAPIAADNHWTLNNARDTVSQFRLPAVIAGACAAQDLTPPAPPVGLRVR